MAHPRLLSRLPSNVNKIWSLQSINQKRYAYESIENMITFDHAQRFDSTECGSIHLHQ